MSKKIILLDSSLLKETDCLYKYHLIHDLGLRTITQNYIMAYGTAFHKFLALYYTNENFHVAKVEALTWYMNNGCMKVPDGDFRTIDHLGLTIDAYIKNYKVDNLKVKSNEHYELGFAYPYLKTDNIEVVLCGTIDFIGTYYGQQCFVDHKVTSLFWKKEQFLNSFLLNNQLKFYRWILNKTQNLKNLPAIVNVIFIKKPLVSEEISLGKKNDFSGANFQRSDFIDYTQEAMEKFDKFLEDRVNLIIKQTTNNDFPENHNRCETVYGPCQFFTVCQLDNQYREKYITNSFQKRIYDPRYFQD